MKNKKKANKKVLLLTSVALVAVVAASIGGTFAWLVSNRTATGTITNIGATAPSDLDIALNGGAVEDDHAFELNANTKTSDISGNGVNFYKPLIGAGSTSNVPIFTEVSSIPVPDPATASNDYMISFTVTFSSSAALDVFVSSATFASAVSSIDNSSGELHKATRVAILDSTNAVKAVIVDENHTSTQYVQSTTLSEGNLDLTNITTVKSNSITTPTLVEETNSYAAGVIHLGRLTGSDDSYSMTMTFRIWHEGTDAACVTANATNVVNLEFGFSALNKAEQL